MSEPDPSRGASDQEPLTKAGRHELILAELRVSPAIRISALAARFGVSTETIRRDLRALGHIGMVSRTYGGAVARPFGFESALEERLAVMAAEREKIADIAAGLVEPGEALMIDGGATTLHFARRLAARGTNLTVITNSLAVAGALGANPGFRVIVCPGTYEAAEGLIVGPDTIAYVTRFQANKLFFSASGLTPEGPVEVNTGAAAVKRAMLARARERILLVDHAKFDQPSLEVVCPLSDLSRVVADAPPPDELASALQSAGTELTD